MNPFRGILMIVAAAIAFWRGWQIHSGRNAWLEYGSAVLAPLPSLPHSRVRTVAAPWTAPRMRCTLRVTRIGSASNQNLV